MFKDYGLTIFKYNTLCPWSMSLCNVSIILKTIWIIFNPCAVLLNMLVINHCSFLLPLFVFNYTVLNTCKQLLMNKEHWKGHIYLVVFVFKTTFILKWQFVLKWELIVYFTIFTVDYDSLVWAVECLPHNVPYFILFIYTTFYCSRNLYDEIFNVTSSLAAVVIYLHQHLLSLCSLSLFFFVTRAAINLCKIVCHRCVLKKTHHINYYVCNSLLKQMTT